jgi:methyl-accepting chemotaxis protein
MQSTWTIRKRLLTAFCVAAVVTLILGATGYYAVSVGSRSLTEIADVRLPSVEALLVISEAQTAVDSGENGLLAREATAEQRKARHDSFDEAKARYEAAWKVYEPLPQTVEEAEEWKRFVPAWQKWVADHEAFVSVAKAFEASPSDDNYAKMSHFAVATMTASSDEAESLLSKLVETYSKEAEDASTAADAQAAFFQTTMLVVAVAAVLLSLGLGWYMSQKLNGILTARIGDLREGAEQVVSASSQVSTSAQSLSQGSTELAASLEETSASMEEMASMTRQNAENARRGAALVEQSALEFTKCDAALKDMVQSTDRILDSSNRVAKILKTIDEIAFQTNILALNAAVEAARAGEAGMGFAVVAAEVRNLAQRAAQAAKDTAVLIDEATMNATQGTAKVKILGESIKSIGTQTTEIKSIVSEVSTASHQQSQGIDQVTQAIAQMEKVTQTTAATAEESAAASEELNAQAELSMSVVEQLQVLVSGATDASGAKRRPVGSGRGRELDQRHAA